MPFLPVISSLRSTAASHSPQVQPNLYHATQHTGMAFRRVPQAAEKAWILVWL